MMSARCAEAESASPSRNVAKATPVPALPGCISEGDSRTEAVANIREAIALYRESLAQRNLAAPQVEEREVTV